MAINETKLNEFMAAYEPALVHAIQTRPTEYAYPVEMAPAVAAKMRAAMVKGSFNHDGHAFKGACKTLGIKHTRTAIVAFISDK